MFPIFFPCQFLLIFSDLIDINYMYQSDLLILIKYMNGKHAWSVGTSMVHTAIQLTSSNDSFKPTRQKTAR